MCDKVYHEIKDAVILGQLAPGQILQEQGVAEEFKVSRATARSALQRLCHEKYLKAFPRKGYLVSGITPAQCRQIQQLRYQIEALALQLIIENRADEEIKSLEEILTREFDNKSPEDTRNFHFHRGLAVLSGNEVVCEVLESLIGDVCRFVITSPVAQRPAYEADYHRAILGALLARDLPAARLALRQDMRMGEDETAL